MPTAYTRDSRKVSLDETDIAATGSLESPIIDVSNASTDADILTDEDIKRQIEHYEMQFGMSSEEFLTKWKAGEIQDTFETNDWAMLLDFV